MRPGALRRGAAIAPICCGDRRNNTPLLGVPDGLIQLCRSRNPLRAAGPYLGHVQVSDSNRLEPGAGHLDWPLFAATLRDVGYRGDIALESRLSGPADEVLPRVPSFLRRYL